MGFDKKSIFKSLLLLIAFKICNILVFLYVTRVVFNSFDSSDFSVWAIVSTIALILGVLDFGYPQSLRNLLTKELNSGKTAENLKYNIGGVSKKIALKYLKVSVLFIPFIIVQISLKEISYLCPYIIIVIIIGISNILKPIESYYNAIGRPETNSFFRFCSSLFILTLVLVYGYSVDKVIYVVILYYGVPVIVQLLRYLLFVRNTRNYSNSAIVELRGLSKGFYKIQITGIIISELFILCIKVIGSSQQLDTFFLSYRIVGLIMTALVVILTPFWSAIAFFKESQDVEKLTVTYNRLKLVLIPVLIALIGFWSYRHSLLSLWGDAYMVNSDIIIVQILFVILWSWNTLHLYVLNGLSETHVQFKVDIVSISIVIIGLILSFLNVMSFGVFLVLMPLSQLHGAIIYPVFVKRYISHA